MLHDSTSEFLADLQDHHELVRVSAPVDSALEIAAITQHVNQTARDRAPALLFEQVKNCSIPVLTNLFGNPSRINICLGIRNLSELSKKLQQFVSQESSGSWLESLRWGSTSNRPMNFGPRIVKTAPCQQVVRIGRDVNLWELPILRHWPAEIYPVITAGHLITTFPDSQRTYQSSQPMAVVGQQQLAWFDGLESQRTLISQAVRRGQNLPVVVSLGGPPILRIAAQLHEIPNKIELAGALRGQGLDLVRCRTCELDAPASADFVIEGYIDAENPFTSDLICMAQGHGRYIERKLPLIQVTAVTHRANPILTALVPAIPPSEESYLSQIALQLRLPLIRRQFPEVTGFYQPLSSNRNLLVVKIEKTDDHHARRILHGLWGMPVIGQTKIIIVIDHDSEIRDEDQLLFVIGNNACIQQDFLYSDGLSRIDDYTSMPLNLTRRLGIDATRKSNGETGRPWPKQMVMSDDILTRLRERWSEYGFNELGEPVTRPAGISETNS